MKSTVFVYTDVVLDLLGRREPHFRAAARLFSLAETGDLRICVSSLAYANLLSILKKEYSAAAATAILKKLNRLSGTSGATVEVCTAEESLARRSRLES